MIYNEFKIGDIVTVVQERYGKCPFSWVESMDQFTGKEVTIVDKWMHDGYNTFGYHIDADNGDHTWCGNCFVEKEMPDFIAAESSDIAAFLGV